MPRFIFSSKYAVPNLAAQALAELDKRVEQALRHIGAAIPFGTLGATPVENLYDAMGVDLRELGIDWLHGRPKIRSDGIRLEYWAPPTRKKGRSHRDHNLLSDLLRGIADLKLRTYIKDDGVRNSIARDFSDGWLFGRPEVFTQRLQECGSIDGMHDEWDIPHTGLTAYAAKFNLLPASISTVLLFREKYSNSLAVLSAHTAGVERNVSYLETELVRLNPSFTFNPKPKSQHIKTIDHLGSPLYLSAEQGSCFGLEDSRSNRLKEMDLLKLVLVTRHQPVTAPNRIIFH